MPLTIGETYQNRYQVEAELGVGGFGRVYKAWDRNLGRWVAIKECQVISDELKILFEREASLLMDLRHPHLPHVIDRFSMDEQYRCLVMTYVEGENLQEILDRQGRPLPESDVIRWIIQVVEAVKFLHRQEPPILHRDIKPANIIITSSGQAVLVDFGIAKIYDPDQTRTTGKYPVSPGFSPYEQYIGNTDPRSDIYSIGATIYKLLTGKSPLGSLERKEGKEILLPPRKLNPEISVEIEQVILMTMQMDPDQRYQNALEMENVLLTSQSLSREGSDAQPLTSYPTDE